MSTWRTAQAGLRPVRMASSAPLFQPLTSYADAAGSSLHQRGKCALLIGFTNAYATGCARIILAFRMS
jgi:hypothetical protein